VVRRFLWSRNLKNEEAITRVGSQRPKKYFASFIILYNEPTNAQLFHKLSHSSYIFRHYCVILTESAVSTLLSYTSMSNAAVGNII